MTPQTTTEDKAFVNAVLQQFVDRARHAALDTIVTPEPDPKLVFVPLVGCVKQSATHHSDSFPFQSRDTAQESGFPAP